MNGSGARTAGLGASRTTVALLTVLVLLTVASGVVWWNVLHPAADSGRRRAAGQLVARRRRVPRRRPAPRAAAPARRPEDDLPRSAEPLADDQIVWRHNVGTDWTMSTVSPEGSRSRVVLASGEQEVAPLVSHDRRTVLYLRRERPGDRSSLHAVAADGSVQRLLFRDGTTSCPYLRQVAWSVDGTLALVCKIDERGTSYTLSTARTDGTVVRTLDVGLIGGPTFSPDGRDAALPQGVVRVLQARGTALPDRGRRVHRAREGGRRTERHPGLGPAGSTDRLLPLRRGRRRRRAGGDHAGRRRGRRHRRADRRRRPRPRPDLVARRALAGVPPGPGRRRLAARGHDAQGRRRADLSRDGTIGAPSWTPR